MATVQELVDRVRNTLDEPVAAQWTDAMLVDWLNEANKDIARVTKHYTDFTTVALIAAQAEYVLPEDVLTIEQAYYVDTASGAGERKVPLIARHWESMDSLWAEAQDWEGAWPQAFTAWGFAPNLRLRLYPVPSISGDQALLLVSRLPAVMSVDSMGADVDAPTAWWDALEDYCEFKALRRDRDPRWQEARGLYLEKRDDLVRLGEQLAVAREIVPDARSGFGYAPWWFADGGAWNW